MITESQQKEIQRQGYARGYNIASWQDLPEIGLSLDCATDYIGLGILSDIDDCADAFFLLCNASEENDRCYTPFEFTAHGFNTLPEFDSETAWEIFDDAIQQGFQDNWNQRKAYYID